MGKTIMFLIFVGLAILLVGGLVSPTAPALWLASTAQGYMYLRIGLLALLAILLLTNPPRNVYFRAFVGILAVTLGAWSIEATYQNHMQFLDTLSILGASVTMAIVALEYQPDETEENIIAVKHQANQISTTTA